MVTRFDYATKPLGETTKPISQTTKALGETAKLLGQIAERLRRYAEPLRDPRSEARYERAACVAGDADVTATRPREVLLACLGETGKLSPLGVDIAISSTTSQWINKISDLEPVAKPTRI
jgi:hypothetical protein